MYVLFRDFLLLVICLTRRKHTNFWTLLHIYLRSDTLRTIAYFVRTVIKTRDWETKRLQAHEGARLFANWNWKSVSARGYRKQQRKETLRENRKGMKSTGRRAIRIVWSSFHYLQAHLNNNNTSLSFFLVYSTKRYGSFLF